MRALAQNLRKIRAEYNLSQGRAAEIIGINRSNYGAYEDDRAQPSLEVFALIVKTFNIIDPIAFATKPGYQNKEVKQKPNRLSIFEKQFQKLEGKTKEAVLVLMGLN